MFPSLPCLPNGGSHCALEHRKVEMPSSWNCASVVFHVCRSGGGGLEEAVGDGETLAVGVIPSFE